MNNPTGALAVSPSLRERPSSPMSALDTTAGSIPHAIFGYGRHRASGRPLPLATIYVAAAAITFAPLLVAALLGPSSLTEVTATHRLPFLRDWNLLFMFFVSFPSLVVLTVNDQRVLASSLHSVESDGTLTIGDAEANSLCVLWRRRFRAINYSGQVLGLMVGGVVAYFNYLTYIPASVGYWIAADNRLLPVGYVYLYAIFLFYCLAPVFILRSIAISLLLRDVVACSRLRMLPLHPDKAGGLRPMGRLGLRNQYLLTIFGLNLVILVAVSFHYLEVPTTLYGLIAAAVLAYLILGPIVFIAPLLSFRTGMLRTKTELLGEVALRLRVELQRLRAELKSGQISKEDEELIDRLRKVGSMIDELPVWPFDAGTLRKFFAAYVIPAISSIGYPIVKAAIELAKRLLASPPDFI